MRQSKPIIRNGVCKDQHVDRIQGEFITFTHIVSSDNISDSVSINIRVNDIALQHLGKNMEKLTA